jgi:hypothetical protein
VRVKEFIERNPDLKGLYVSPDGRWFDAPRKGFKYQSREEILGTGASAVTESKAPEAPAVEREQAPTVETATVKRSTKGKNKK